MIKKIKPKCLICSEDCKRQNMKYCSRKCSAIDRAKKHDMSKRFGKYSLKGNKFTLEQRKKFSENKKGEKHWNWKGGITALNYRIRHSLEYKLWRTAVFERDNYTCIWCGLRSKKNGRLEVNADHIKPFAVFPELRFSVDNGRTLCEDCHSKTDTFKRKNIKKLYE